VKGYLWCVAAMTVLGASVAISRLILAYPALTGQAVRYAVAAAILALLVRGPARRPGPGDLGRLVLLAATGLVGFNLCLLAALRHADPAVIGVVVGCTPLVLALVGPLVAGTRRRVRSGARRAVRPGTPSAIRPGAPRRIDPGRALPWRLVVGAGFVAVGSALVEGTGRADRIGLFAAAGALVGEVLFSLVAASLLPRLGPVRVSAWTCALAVPMLAVAAVVAGERPRPPTVAEAAAYGYLAIVLTVGAFVVWYGGLQRLGVARAGMFVGVLPVATLASTAVMDARLPAAPQVVGVLVVAAALRITMITDGSGSYDDADLPRSSGSDSAARTASAYPSTAARSAPSASTP
jgi:drug/metabolite transporter (DMT)-like permease